MLTRREWISLAAAPALLATPARPLVDTHVHLFAADQSRFPYHPQATYKPPAQPLEKYLSFWREAGVDRVVIVHPEPYQDDHRYLEYCFAHEPSPNFFKGTCLFDPTAPDTPDRMTALVKRNPGRIVALRIHEVRPGGAPSDSGAIKERDLGAPAMKATWRRAQELGMAIQMHFVPVHAPQIGELAGQFPDVPVILDHLARAGQGTAAEFENVLKLAAFPRVYMKYSGVEYSSKQKFPFADVKPTVKRLYDVFGPDRLIWGGLGHDMKSFQEQKKLFAAMFEFAPEAARVKIRGKNAIQLFHW